MKRIILLGLLLLALSGCMLPPVALEAIVERVGPLDDLRRPLISHGDDWYAIVLNGRTLLFGTDTDQYGNPTGLSDDTVWSIVDVTIKCALRAGPDTVFNPGDPFQRLGFSSDGIDNACLWWPGYIAPTEPVSGLPRTPYPYTGGYPALCFEESPSVPSMASQMATITARARAECLPIRITLPERDGTYTLDLPGATPTSNNVIELTVGEWGEIDVIHSDGDVYAVEVPADWFWLTGSWEITVGPYVGCGS